MRNTPDPNPITAIFYRIGLAAPESKWEAGSGDLFFFARRWEIISPLEP
jgi:hypothetical protein